MTKWICPNCQKSNPPKRDKCWHCGNPRSEDPGSTFGSEYNKFLVTIAEIVRCRIDKAYPTNGSSDRHDKANKFAGIVLFCDARPGNCKGYP